MASIKERLNAYATSRQPQELLTLIADLAADLETLKARHNGVCTKLDADAGVTDTNYSALQAVGVLATQP